MTKLTKEISRETEKTFRGRHVVITLVPGTDRREALVCLRLKGQRTEFRGTLSDLYRILALWHGNAERLAKLEARRNGIPWREAKKRFRSR